MHSELPILPATRAFLARQLKMRIGADWQDAASGRTMTLRNPASGEVLAEVPAAEAQDVDRAVQAARQAFEHSAWSRMRPRERQNLLWRLADLMQRDAQELAELECLNNGKSAAVAQVMDVQLAIDFLRYMAGWATKLEGSTVEPSLPLMPNDDFHAFVRREAVGVVGAIVAWNFPLLLACWKLGPALATGCTVVLKPADETPLTALKLAELVSEAGYPDGVFNVITGTGLNAGAALSRHPGVDKLTFTGSTEVGKLIGKAAMDNMTRVTLELGGKSPNIIFADADLDSAINGAVAGIYAASGQSCVAGSRLLVQDEIFDEFVERLIARAKSIRIGNPQDDSSEMGPIATAQQLAVIEGLVAAAKAEGATLRMGGKRAEVEGDGWFYEPTLFECDSNSMTIMQEEVFGPVAAVIRFKTEEQALAMANDSQFGLAAGIWTRDLGRAHRLARDVRSGIIWVNTYRAVSAMAPIGGFKNSGYGRESGIDSVLAYTELKTVWINLSTAPMPDPFVMR